MRILHVAYIYPPRLEVSDGITHVVLNVTKELARRGHEVTVYASNLMNLNDNDSLPDGHAIVNGVDVHYSRCVWHHKTFMVTPSIVSGLLKGIDRFDIVHIHDARSFQGISTYLFASLKRVPYVYQPHGSFLSSLRDSPPKRIARVALDGLFGSKILSSASKVIALSQAEVEQYRRVGVPIEKIAVVPNGIDLSEYADLPPRGSFRKRFALDENAKLILYLGRMHKIKGIDILVRAFKDVVGKIADAKLVVVGPDDGYLLELEALIKALEIEDNVLVLGSLSGSDKLEAYVDADVYVLPSRYETFPISVLEAVACRTPVILTGNCGIADCFKGKVGLVANPDSSHLSESLLEMLLNQSKRGVFRENCSALIKRFSISKTVSKLEEVYEEVLN